MTSRPAFETEEPSRWLVRWPWSVFLPRLFTTIRTPFCPASTNSRTHFRVRYHHNKTQRQGITTTIAKMIPSSTKKKVCNHHQRRLLMFLLCLAIFLPCNTICKASRRFKWTTRTPRPPAALFFIIMSRKRGVRRFGIIFKIVRAFQMFDTRRPLPKSTGASTSMPLTNAWNKHRINAKRRSFLSRFMDKST